MGISRDSVHKRRKTGGRKVAMRKKRKFELGRPPANTKIGEKRVSRVRVRGGNFKFRALKLEYGNFTWPSQSCTRKTRVIIVQYNATSNELVRTNTLVKGCIIQVDASPFKTWFLQYYNENLGKKDESKEKKEEVKEGEVKEEETIFVEKERKDMSKRRKSYLHVRQGTKSVEDALRTQFKTGRLYAKVTSRPGQCGRVDGYILEGEELAFYTKKILERKRKV